MSRENLELCRRVYDLWNSAEYEAFLALMSPDVELVEGAYTPEVGVYRGREGIRRWASSNSDVFNRARFEPVRFIEGGDVVVIELLFHGQGTNSGAEVTARYAHVMRVREGMIAYVAAYPNIEQALEAVGLSG